MFNVEQNYTLIGNMLLNVNLYGNRNKEIYGDSLGPDAKWLFDRKKRKMLQQGIEPIDEDIWQSIIQSSMKKDEVLNTLLGIKHK